MTLSDALTFFLIMITLAAMPSTSVALVVTRSATQGISSGILVSLGIVLGDLVFIILAILGLSVLADAMGNLFLGLKYIGAIYLIWFGYSLLRSKNKTTIPSNVSYPTSSLLGSFLAGLFITLGDIKAMFFYASLFPVFIDLRSLNVSDIAIIISVTIATVGSVKITYAILANKLMTKLQGHCLGKVVEKLAACALISSGIYLIVNSH